MTQSSAIKYNFGLDFQTAILNIILTNDRFVAEHLDIINPSHFNDAGYQAICEDVILLFKRYRELPSLELLREVIRSKVGGESLLETLDYVLNKKCVNVKGIVEQVIEFARYQAINGALVEVKSLIDEGETAEAHRVMRNAFMVGMSGGDYDYVNDVGVRLKRYDEIEEYMPTGWKTIDKCIEGGIHREEMGLIIAMPSGGKTAGLVHLGVIALSFGFNVIHYSLELRTCRVARRYDMAISNMTKQELITNKADVMHKVLSLKGKLIIKKFPTGKITCDEISNHLLSVKDTGVRIDMIIIDYDSLLRPIIKMREDRNIVKCTYEEMRGLADEFKCAVWTASQTNKRIFEMKEGEVITGREATESLEGKLGTPDVALSFNQTIREYRAKRMRIHVIKSREDEGRATVECSCDFSRMSIWEL